MVGNHSIKAWSKTPALISKSSGESELYGAVRGATKLLGIIAYFVGKKFVNQKYGMLSAYILTSIKSLS